MRLIDAIREKFRYQPFRVKFAAGFLTLFVLGIVFLLLTAAAVDLGALLVMGFIGLVFLFFWAIITLAGSGL